MSGEGGMGALQSSLYMGLQQVIVMGPCLGLAAVSRVKLTCGAATSCAWHREALETIYARGGRKFLVWGLVAIEQVPIVQTVNKYVNVLDEFFTHTRNDTTTQYGLKVSVRHLLLSRLPSNPDIRIA